MTGYSPGYWVSSRVSIHIPLEERMTADKRSYGSRSNRFQFTYRSRSG